MNPTCNVAKPRSLNSRMFAPEKEVKVYNECQNTKNCHSHYLWSSQDWYPSEFDNFKKLVYSGKNRFSHKDRFFREGELQKTHDNPKNPLQKFTPSRCLVELVEKHMQKPDEETQKTLRELKELKIDIKEEGLTIGEILTEKIEALLTSIARRISRTGEIVKISQENKFAPNISRELIDRLGLDAFDTRPVLEQLYKELREFVSSISPERKWGKITYDNAEFKLNIKPNVFSTPNINEIDQKYWKVTK
ncbi:MAG: hypothetical protein L7F77_14460 [Candidatus Magnetominusculus sp. LBB02]|nr:hypothetical protein [Candidatus Magnetominusculus sp. LBB02]